MTDILAVFPKDMRVGTKPIRDALIAAMAQMITTYRSKAAYAAEQSNALDADDLYLDGFGKDVGIPRNPGELDDDYRLRLFQVPALVTPEAIMAAVNSLVAPYTVGLPEYHESELDCNFVSDGSLTFDAFVGQNVGPHYSDRFYPDDTLENAGYLRPQSDPGGFWVFPGSGLGRFFVIRVPDLTTADSIPAFVADFDFNESFISDNTDASGTESAGTDVTFIYGDTSTTNELYDNIVYTVNRIKGAGIRFMVLVDPALTPEAAVLPPFPIDFTTYSPGALTASRLLADKGVGFSRASDGHTVRTSDVTIATGITGNDIPRIAQRTASSASRGLALQEARTNSWPAARNLAYSGLQAGLTDSITNDTWVGPGGELTPNRAQKAAIVADGYSKYFSGSASQGVASLWVSRGSTTNKWQASLGGNYAHPTYQVTAQTGPLPGSAVTPGTIWNFESFRTTSFTNFVPVDSRAIFRTGGTYSTSFATEVGVDWIQLEGADVSSPAITFATDAILTTTASRTRAAERLSRAQAPLMCHSGRLDFYLRIIPLGDSDGYTSDMYLWTDSIDANSCWIDHTTRQIKVLINGVTVTITNPMYWLAGDVVEIYVGAGGGITPTVAAYRRNNSYPIPLGTGAIQDRFTPFDTMDLCCNGTANTFTGDIQYIDISPPSWYTSAPVVPPPGLIDVDFRDRGAFPIGTMSNADFYLKTGLVHTGTNLPTFSSDGLELGDSGVGAPYDDVFKVPLTEVGTRIVSNGHVAMRIDFKAKADAQTQAMSMWQARVTSGYSGIPSTSTGRFSGQVLGVTTQTDSTTPFNVVDWDNGDTAYIYFQIGGGIPTYAYCYGSRPTITGVNYTGLETITGPIETNSFITSDDYLILNSHPAMAIQRIKAY